ncbi:stage II sporulation protein M [Bacteroidales bacterium OttesenSCG-928-I14]|nr:stage II sporulation protein M [Bacteroidales bacterium OttesenSCG-928-I14]
MKEAVFIRLNKEKWRSYEESIKNISQQTPNHLTDIYIDLTNDLSFAQTQYPNSFITLYLNSLSAKLHQFIHRKKKKKLSSFFRFWKVDAPLAIHESQKELRYSFIIFITAVIIGCFSTIMDPDFARLILSDNYIEMTLKNISNDDPMAVYKDENMSDMFFGITLNNIRVSFNTFAAGLLTSLGTGYFILYNGIMVGAFQTFFYNEGLLWTSFLTIWIHGTIEMSELILAGAAGIVMGNGLLFPGTYTRLQSFRRSARRGIKLIICGIPMVIFAGFLESFVTRLTDMPDFLKIAIIALSLAFVLFYYIWYPKKVAIKHNKNN